MATFCIPKEYASKLKAAVGGGGINISELMTMSSAQRRAVFETYTNPELAKGINAGFEKAMISKQKDSLKKWVDSTFNAKAKSSPAYKDILTKINELDELGVLNPKSSEAFLQDLVATKLGATVSANEAQKINELAKNLQKLEGQKSEFGTPTIDYFQAKKEMEDYLDSITPRSKTRVATETIGRGSLLLSIKSPLLNIESNTVQGFVQAFARRIETRTSLGSNNNYALEYVKFVNEVYDKTGYDVSRMLTLSQDRMIRGEEKSTSQGPGAVRKLGRVYEDIVYKKLLGKPDVVAASVAFADRANLESTKIAKAAGLTKTEAKTKALEIFKDATKIVPETAEGQLVRDNAIADAMYSTFTNDSKWSEVGLGIRKVFNLASGDLRFGDLNMPFVKTPANVIGATVESSGALVPVDATIRMFKSVKAVREGRNTTEAFGENFNGFSQKIVKAGLGLTFTYLLASMIDPEDYIGEWPTSIKEQELLRLKKANTNSILIGGKWVSLDYFGVLGAPLVGMLYAKKYGDTLPDKVFQYYLGVAKQAVKIPGFEDMASLYETVQKTRSNDTTLGEKMSEVSNYLISFVRARTIPSIVSDVAKGTDSVEREVGKGDPVGALKAGIPGLRQLLPEKKNVLGQVITTEGLLSTLLFGARVKTAESSELLTELNRLSTSQNLPAITDVEKTSSRVKDLKAQVGEEKFVELKTEYTDRLRSRIGRIITTGQYKKSDDDKKAAMIDKIKSEEVERLLKKGKYRKPSKDKQSSLDVTNNLIADLFLKVNDLVAKDAYAAEDGMTPEDFSKPGVIARAKNLLKKFWNGSADQGIIDPQGKSVKTSQSNNPYKLTKTDTGMTRIIYPNGSFTDVQSDEETERYLANWQKNYKEVTGQDWPSSAPNWVETVRNQEAPREQPVINSGGKILGITIKRGQTAKKIPDVEVRKETKAKPLDESKPYPARGGNPWQKEIKDIFGEDAADFERVMGWDYPDGRPGGGENRGYNPKAENKNKNGTLDIGLLQINEGTYKDFSRRHKSKLDNLGISAYTDLYDPIKNLQFAKVIFDEQGFNAWYGAPPDLRKKR